MFVLSVNDITKVNKVFAEKELLTSDLKFATEKVYDLTNYIKEQDTLIDYHKNQAILFRKIINQQDTVIKLQEIKYNNLETANKQLIIKVGGVCFLVGGLLGILFF